MLRRANVPDLIAGRRLGCTALTEPGAESDFAAIETRATRCDSGWLIHGAKAWITNASDADVVILYAQTDPGSGSRGIACFVIDGRRDGFVREPAYALGGQHTIGAGGFRLEGYRARDEELLQLAGKAFKAALISSKEPCAVNSRGVAALTGWARSQPLGAELSAPAT
jgi:alkylation response protein AidB-like acyl-CoA dehydrogenase